MLASLIGFLLEASPRSQILRKPLSARNFLEPALDQLARFIGAA
jgi:hypothetical protein